ncbi:MAG: PEPxxWA-CTERM sorting domain-containing protein [Candidatus Sphingomonas colombiensis]|nr:PEPxxWA-CTERM sorting domain-containing protein [Sphingomonas sp.]WEK43804.1 MAG: PEPxxWA-CTERM sorting domain-containing protein [Sphingomonas sp.]
MRISVLLASAVAVAAASPCAAQTATFVLTGSHTANFILPLSPTDIDPAGHNAGLDDPTIFALTSSATVDGTMSPILFHFYTAEGGGGMDIIGLGLNFFRFSPAGDSVFKGTIYSPTFLPGEYDFTDFEVPGLAYHLSINANALAGIPEPGSWAMMLAGFGGIGFAMRRRQKVRTNVSFA